MMRNEIDEPVVKGIHVCNERMEALAENAVGPTESLEYVQGHDHALEHQELEAQNRNAPPPEANPFMQQFIKIMQRMAPQPQLHDAVIDKNYVVVRRQGVKVFEGTADPAEAEEWLRNTERVLDRIQSTFKEKLRCVVFLFKKDALDWWEIVPGSKNRPINLTWNDFLKEFADKYTPPVYKNCKKVEFLELKQNELSVAGYELQFVRLSKYAPEEVSADELRKDRFERRLRLEIRKKITIKPPNYGNLNSIPGQSGAVSFRGSGLQRGWYRGRGMGQTSRSLQCLLVEEGLIRSDLGEDKVQQDHSVEDLFPLRFPQSFFCFGRVVVVELSLHNFYELLHKRVCF
ncbi:UNVERIFIED_CONTAM: hypothetical protein Scaly_0086900 [Sesamum calycinum]|uniref:Retrotransposon gag domain-containing protein n=1 Tax=Sesamum calycinum TaxID=2727403 RepID=A0AAW2SVB6_9LAMI